MTRAGYAAASHNRKETQSRKGENIVCGCLAASYQYLGQGQVLGFQKQFPSPTLEKLGKKKKPSSRLPDRGVKNLLFPREPLLSPGDPGNDACHHPPDWLNSNSEIW